MSLWRWLRPCLFGVIAAAGLARGQETVFAEAEEFKVISPGWEAKKWGTNYCAGTMANTFLSRKAYLGAPDQCDRTEASIELMIPKSGTYLALVRYEESFRFETQFRLQVVQGGKVKLDRLYGARDNLKIWAFKEGLKREVAWSWGAVENLVWEGHDATVDLEAGPATLTLIADRQPGSNVARRNVDLVMLTSDRKQVEERIAKENYLPLDGMLTQAGDLFLRVHNSADGNELTLHVGTGKEHSPYWVHIRNWKAKEISAKPGETTNWTEVGSLLDSLNDGQWAIGPDGEKSKGPFKFSLEFGVPDGAGKITPIRRFDDLTGETEFAYDADTRHSRRIRLTEELLYDLLAYLKNQPVSGIAPKRTLIYGYTFAARPKNAKFTAALEEFKNLMGASALASDRMEDITSNGAPRGYIDVRGVPTPKLDEFCKKLEAEGRADRIAVVSMGDEIDLPKPPAKSDEAFITWLKSQNLKPTFIDPQAGEDWSKIHFSPSSETQKSNPGLYYYSKIWSYRYGIATMKDRTEILHKHLSNAGIGANFSPHPTAYLGDVHHWISVFREGGMTMPWGEDYIWQLPVGTQQMNFITLDMYRAGIADFPQAKIHFYVMAHTPGNTPASWRRQFYGDLAHGAKIINLYELRPVQVAYTENHVSAPAMYQAVRTALHELGRFEDIVQDGHVRPAQAALWFSEAADVWHDNRSPFAAAKRTLYIAIRHHQIPLDMLVEGMDLSKYRVIYLTDRHVSRAASKALAKWVEQGGHLFATAGAGLRDEMDRPNQFLADLFGIREETLEESKDRINREKEDLPWAGVMDQVKAFGGGEGRNVRVNPLDVLGAKSRFTLSGAKASHAFGDGSTAVASRSIDKGSTSYCGFLPGLAYFKPAIPKQPLDRGTADDSFAHFIPNTFDAGAATLIASPAVQIERPTNASEPLVETAVLESDHGIAIPLINWSGHPVKGLTLQLNLNAPGKHFFLASGGTVKEEQREGKRTFIFDLDVADALIVQ
jgi:hypothetical protein